MATANRTGRNPLKPDSNHRRGWFSSVEFHVAREELTAVKAAGLDTYEALMRDDRGERVVDEPTRQVRRLELPCGRVYLKRAWGEKPLKLLSSWLLGRRPQSAPMREYQMLKRLSEAGLAAARPVAWGQKRVWGVPAEGFLMTEAVEGRPFDEAWVNAQGGARLVWLEKMGSLLGGLHAAGFFHILRLKDLIATPDGRLVMIDREVAHPWPRKFSVGRCEQGLARCAAKFIRSGNKLTAAELLAVMLAYLKGVRPMWDGEPGALRDGVEGRLNAILAQRRYAGKKLNDHRGTENTEKRN